MSVHARTLVLVESRLQMEAIRYVCLKCEAESCPLLFIEAQRDPSLRATFLDSFHADHVSTCGERYIRALLGEGGDRLVGELQGVPIYGATPRLDVKEISIGLTWRYVAADGGFGCSLCGRFDSHEHRGTS